MKQLWYKRCAALLAPLFCVLTLFGCAAAQPETDPASVLTTTAPLSDDVGETAAAVSQNDENRDLQIDTYVILQDDATAINGDGAAYADGRLTVSKAGVYSLKGTLTDGQIYVDSDDDSGKVKLYLDGVEICCKDSAPIYVAQSPKETCIILAKDSENKLIDNADRTMTDAQAEDKTFATAALYSMDDLQIEGEGALTIEANFRKGIFSRDALQIKSGTLTVTAADDAIRGKDSVKIAGGTLRLKSGGDGIRTSNEGKGDITVSGGDITIESAQDCIQAVGNVSISGGSFLLQSGGGYQASLQTQQSGGGFFGGFGKNTAKDASGDSVSAKGIKADGSIAISGGAFTLDCLDDAVHADESVAVSGGNFKISTNDDGVHAEESVAIAGGSFAIEASYEGVEGNVISISGGTLDITAQDDGMNAAAPGDQNDMTFFRGAPEGMEMPTDESGNPPTMPDGERPQMPTDENGNPLTMPDGVQPPTGDTQNDQSGFSFRRQGGGRGSMGGMDQADESCAITVSGGNIRINASGDGIDSNGSITVSGGTILVFGPTNNGNGALDYAGSCVVTGGTVFAIGSAGMAQGVSNGSVASIEGRGSFSEGDALTITDESGAELYAVTLEKQASHLVFASGRLQSGKVYTLNVNGAAQGTYTAK